MAHYQNQERCWCRGGLEPYGPCSSTELPSTANKQCHLGRTCWTIKPGHSRFLPPIRVYSSFFPPLYCHRNHLQSPCKPHLQPTPGLQCQGIRLRLALRTVGCKNVVLCYAGTLTLNIQVAEESEFISLFFSMSARQHFFFFFISQSHILNTGQHLDKHKISSILLPPVYSVLKAKARNNGF